ncbi:hypothetical protein K490DRAFT_63663 [Saccharata proteae CBS 121410]|uniref:Uncharacterized protein n=1 Tax=Saccharata proteae CBS 121410 TaxID=1314787 RepID=A0A6A5YCB4_9PEZI|nr:hypothetical protein K490DRAFT_63663 [Saccharata proteae CBS 121410]
MTITGSDFDTAIQSPLSVEITLLPLEIGTYSLRAGDTDVVSVQPFRKTSITTKVTDFQHCYFVDGRTCQKHDVCVVFLQFQFNRQKQGGHFNQRITDMTIAIRAERGGQARPLSRWAPTMDASPTYTKNAAKGEQQQLVMKAVLPRVALGAPENRTVKHSLGASLGPEGGGISLGGAEMARETSYKVPYRSSFKTSIDEGGAAILDLRENKLHEAGVPEVVDCALVLQTDGLPFTLDLSLFGRTPFAGIRMTGSAELSIGQRYLWVRPWRGDAAKKGADWRDIDSDEFVEWVKSKTENHWADVADYDMTVKMESVHGSA